MIASVEDDDGDGNIIVVGGGGRAQIGLGKDETLVDIIVCAQTNKLLLFTGLEIQKTYMATTTPNPRKRRTTFMVAFVCSASCLWSAASIRIDSGRLESSNYSSPFFAVRGSPLVVGVVVGVVTNLVHLTGITHSIR